METIEYRQMIVSLWAIIFSWDLSRFCYEVYIPERKNIKMVFILFIKISHPFFFFVIFSLKPVF